MPLILPTAEEYARMVTAESRRRAVHRLLVESRHFDETQTDVARRLYARMDRDCPELIAERQRILATEYSLPRRGWTRHKFEGAT